LKAELQPVRIVPIQFKSLIAMGHQSDSLPQLSRAERRKLRMERLKKKQESDDHKQNPGVVYRHDDDEADKAMLDRLSRNEDELLNFVSHVNKLYEDILRKEAPFMTFVLCGMQSAGKSTIMERFLSSVLNIVQEGTGTRCPLDTTCIHDDSLDEPRCELRGVELEAPGERLTAQEVFKRITQHNINLGKEDKFSTHPLRLIYRARNVQNMRFVDTPGIISTLSTTGRDNRDDIKEIIENEMKRPNTKLCVLLEPKEFATNPIVMFCDEKLGRENWIKNAIFLMTKFDKQMEDSRTGSKANSFFKEFHSNGCFPFLVVTPTLPIENLPPDALYLEREKLLASADESEGARFKAWLDGHAAFYKEIAGGDEVLSDAVSSRIGFRTAKKEMREIMLKDTLERVPLVVNELRAKMNIYRAELDTLQNKHRLTKPDELKPVVQALLHEVKQRIVEYLNGSLQATMKFPERLQSLNNEIMDEENEDRPDGWSSRELNFHSENEDDWRDHIASLEEYPEGLQADQPLFGGKQVQRAIAFFKVVGLEALPNPISLKDKVVNCVGYLDGDLERENWERALSQVTLFSMKNLSQPGVNYLVKHVGNILRRLFTIAIVDVKQGNPQAHVFRLLPPAVDRFLSMEFDSMLWNLMTTTAANIHCALEPTFYTMDSSLPSLRGITDDDERELNELKGTETPPEESSEAILTKISSKLYQAIAGGSECAVKELLRSDTKTRAQAKMPFLPEKRAAMITEEEINTILQHAVVYMYGLMDHNHATVKFHIKFFYLQFKKQLEVSMLRKGDEANWSKIVKPDPHVEDRIHGLKAKIEGLNASLQEVARLKGS
jgi:Dynamin family